MKQATIKNRMIGFGTLILAMSIIMSGMMFSPNNASAFWWPWGEHHAHAQGNNYDDDDEPYVLVGYSVGTTSAAAAAATVSTTTPSFTNLTSDQYVIVWNETCDDDETDLAMKFADWTQSGNDHILPVAGNMRISSDQASDSNLVVTLSAADTYSTPELTMTGDLNEDEEGLQVQVLVEVAVPSGTYNGTYSTNYGVRTLP